MTRVATSIRAAAGGRPSLLPARPPDTTGPADRRVTLEGLLDSLGSEVVTVVAAPAGLEVEIRRDSIHDPSEPLRAQPGDVVLAVGTSADDPALPATLQAAAEADAAAVVIKAEQADGRLVAAARRAGIALLAVASHLDWSLLHTLIRSVLTSAGHAPVDQSPFPLGDLFALADAIAMMVGGPTTIEDTQYRVLAYSNLDDPIDPARRDTILARRVPDEWVERLHRAGVFKQLWGTHDVVRIDTANLAPEQDMADRLAVAIRTGGEILGSIWVAQGDTPLGPGAEQALAQAAEIAALHLVRHRTDRDIDRRARGDLLRCLLDGRGSTSTIADRLGLPVDTPSVVVAFELQTTDEATSTLQRARAFELVAMHCDAYRRQSLQLPVGRTLYALMPLGNDANVDGVRRLAAEVLDRAEAVLTVPLVVGIGGVAHTLHDVPVSRCQADQVTRVLASGSDNHAGPPTAVACFEDVRAQAVLLELQDHARTHPDLMEGRINALQREDERRGSVYVPTLHAYFECFGDASAAAASMDVHTNTLRYRLRRACEISGLDLANPDERLVATLQLRLSANPSHAPSSHRLLTGTAVRA